MFLPGGAFAAEVATGARGDSSGLPALKLEFLEAQYAMRRDYYPVSEVVAMKCMALEIRMQHGPWTGQVADDLKLKDKLPVYIAPRLLKGKNKRGLTQMAGYVIAEWKQHAKKGDAQCMKAYIDLIAEECPFFYGAFFYHVTVRHCTAQCDRQRRRDVNLTPPCLPCQTTRPIRDKLRPIVVAIGFNGVTLFITRRGVPDPPESHRYTTTTTTRACSLVATRAAHIA